MYQTPFKRRADGRTETRLFVRPSVRSSVSQMEFDTCDAAATRNKRYLICDG